MQQQQKNKFPKSKIFSLVSDSEEAEIEALISKRIQFDDIFNSSFAVKRTDLVWVGNGKFLHLVIHALKG